MKETQPTWIKQMQGTQHTWVKNIFILLEYEDVFGLA